MNAYYETLGLEPSASQLEIKKAYFNLIRKFSPESDPEMFKKIRQAYEALKDGNNQADGLSFPLPEDEFARRMLSQIQNCMKAKDYELCRDTCEEAFHYFPNETQFLYLLIDAQLACGNTGKAVKNAELLVKKQPDNKWFLKQLAFSYFERGYTNKAWQAFDKAYKMGCNDRDFIQTYAILCREYGENDTGIQLLFQVLEMSGKWNKTNFLELAEIYMGLLAMDSELDGMYFEKIIESLIHTLKEYKLYVSDYIVAFSSILYALTNLYQNIAEHSQKIEEVFDLLLNTCNTDDDRKHIHDVHMECDYMRLKNDPRINETFLHYADALYFLDDEEPQIVKFAKLDAELCLLAEWQETLKQALVLKQDYPAFYEGMKEFLSKLDNGTDLDILKENLKKPYQRLDAYIAGGYYYEKYPQERPKGQGTIINESAKMEPYVRTSAKIGRNDPCPCGSGKKYKKCCMGK